jgi:hypothetical protein
METEQNWSLPFLDFLVSRRSDGSLGHMVYRKPTHTDFYLHPRSKHHPAQKRVVLTTLIHVRAWTIRDAGSFNMEIEHLKKIFRQNGYSNQDIKQALHHKKKPQSQW